LLCNHGHASTHIVADSILPAVLYVVLPATVWKGSNTIDRLHLALEIFAIPDGVIPSICLAKLTQRILEMTEMRAREGTIGEEEGWILVKCLLALRGRRGARQLVTDLVIREGAALLAPLETEEDLSPLQVGSTFFTPFAQF
jgi:hypothetical protein